MKKEIGSKILNFLASSSGFHSGSMIARKLKISRTAISEKIRKFRTLGCKIESRPGQGYRLVSVPDKLLPPFITIGLKTTIIGRQVFFYPKIDSTNAQAKEIAVHGVPDGTLVIADYQTQGQGRLKRQWVSPPKKNLLFSVVFYPSVAPSKVFQMTFFASLAVCKTLNTLFKIKAGIKWPNDVYVNHRKICGALTDVSLDQKRVKWVVVGIGLNVNADLSLDPELCNLATSIKRETGRVQKRLPILKRILEEMDCLYKCFLSGETKRIRDEWLSYSIILGKKVTIFSDGRPETGIAETIDGDGALILLAPDGKREKIVAGDVSLRIQETEDRSQESEVRSKESE
ncbi:MAG: biotin--[acetyl-CoA-carboxylase] ligase [Thermodesulfobacteriota bacterium]|jgi:BirA family biotin operon repressor/biotin-[acetyl-CoA-carboxylase] ligase|nr:MAG: biotin--[acetyl-CoA-carboxylase] ligase [Thermodesulfobacteriota bacterium]